MLSNATYFANYLGGIMAAAIGFIFGYLWAYLKNINSRKQNIGSKNLALNAIQNNILTNNLAAAVILRDQDHKIIYCSPYTEVLTGYAVSEILNSESDFFLGIMHQEDQERYQRALSLIKVGEPFQFRFRFIHKTGIEIWAETRTVPVFNELGELHTSLSVTLDVTAAVRYQQQVEEKNRDLQDFTYMVTHDLKSPIFTIKGMLQLLQEDHHTDLKPEIQEILAHIRRANERLEILVTRVLEYSKINSQQFAVEAVDLNIVINDVLKDFSTQLHEAKAQISLTDNLPKVSGDPIHLYRVFANLISNAIKYRSTERQLQIYIAIEAIPPNSKSCSLYVQDNGIGIAKDLQKSLFRPFNRAHDSKIEGTGVGLASVKKMLEKMGATVEISSDLGQGCKIKITFKKAA